MEVERCELKWAERYPVFASRAYLSTLGKSVSYYSVLDVNGQVWIIPCVERRGFFKIVQPRTEPFNLETGMPADGQTQLAILDAFVAQVRRSQDIIVPSPVNALSFQAPSQTHSIDDLATCVVDLNLDEETLWKNLHSKHRNVIRKAMSMGVQIKSDSKFHHDGYKVYCDSQNRSNNHIESRGFYFKLLEVLGQNAVQYVALHDGIVQASALILYSQYAAYYVHGGSVSGSVSGASNFLHWKIMLDMKTQGVQQYDLMGIRRNPDPGSKYEGLRRFKERFGGQIKYGCIWHIGFDRLKYMIWKFVRKQQ